jgi:nitrite transporter NirC
MYAQELQLAAESAAKKNDLWRTRPSAALVHSAMAGAYVGLAVILVVVLGAPFAAAKSPATNLVVAGAFALALSLVIVAGSDLFTGNAMVLPVGAFARRITWKAVACGLLLSWLGNRLGSALVAQLAFTGGVLHADQARDFVATIAARKMHLGFTEAFVRGILCNWLVVLAVWCSYRLKSEAAKLIMVFWCLLGFVGSGYEHSVANMTLFTAANLLPHGPEISWLGMVENLVPVTLGNVVSGALLMAAAYWHVSSVERKEATSNVVAMSTAPRRTPSRPPPPPEPTRRFA